MSESPLIDAFCVTVQVPSGVRLSPMMLDCWFALGSDALSADAWLIVSRLPAPPSWLKVPQQRTGSVWVWPEVPPLSWVSLQRFVLVDLVGRMSRSALDLLVDAAVEPACAVP